MDGCIKWVTAYGNHTMAEIGFALGRLDHDLKLCILV